MKIIFLVLANCFAQFNVESADPNQPSVNPLPVTITRFVSDALPAILQNTDVYHVNLTKIENHGCWCSKLGQDTKSFNGGKAIDDYDNLCKSWFQTRNCVSRETLICNSAGFEEYQINLKTEVHFNAFRSGDPLQRSNVALYDNVDEHCAPVMAMADDGQKACMVSVCRTDYVALSQLINLYDDTSVGGTGECKSPDSNSEDVDDNEEDESAGGVGQGQGTGNGGGSNGTEGSTKIECTAIESWPYVDMPNHNHGFRKKRDSSYARGPRKFRLAQNYGQKYGQK